MAQLNIKEKWWSDPRRLALIDLIGEIAADGLMVKVWRLAQDYLHLHNTPIPKPVFERLPHYEELIKCGLVHRQRSYFYVKGTRSSFKWLIDSRSNGAKGGESKGKKSRDALETPNLIPSLNPSLSLIPNLNLNIINSNPEESPSEIPTEVVSCVQVSRKVSKPKPEKEPLPTREFIGAYQAAYAKRYGPRAKVTLTQAHFGMMKRFLQETPIDRACEMVQVYLAMQDRWFETKAHDLSTFFANQTKIALSLDTGHDSSKGPSLESMAAMLPDNPLELGHDKN